MDQIAGAEEPDIGLSLHLCGLRAHTHTYVIPWYCMVLFIEHTHTRMLFHGIVWYHLLNTHTHTQWLHPSVLDLHEVCLFFQFCFGFVIFL